MGNKKSHGLWVNKEFLVTDMRAAVTLTALYHQKYEWLKKPWR